MWPFRKKQARAPEVQYHDQAILELAQMFLACPADPTPGSEALDLARFDFSVASLGAMDEHLEQIRSRSMTQRDSTVLVLRAGAYVGEVIKRSPGQPREWHWLDYDQAAKLVAAVASSGMSIGTAAILWDGADSALFPLAKVAKYLENGAADSVKFYAQAMIALPKAIAEGRLPGGAGAWDTSAR